MVTKISPNFIGLPSLCPAIGHGIWRLYLNQSDAKVMPKLEVVYTRIYR